MTFESMEDLLYKSAALYYQYLTDKQKQGDPKGAKIITVSDITPCDLPLEYTLSVSEKILHPDECRIRVQDQHIETIRILSYSGNSVQILDTENYLCTLPDLLPEHITIVSDMTYLVKRIGLFYKNTKLHFNPVSPKNITPLPDNLMAHLSAEQHDAVDAVFNNGVSYIHGAPGTGKTKAVLASCVLRYVFSEKKILLLAPTNNAVEQMLRGVLPILRENGIPLERVYRLGSSSAEFAKEYPEVVGDTALEALVDELLAQKVECQQKIDIANNAFQNAELHGRHLARIQSLHDNCKMYLSSLQSIINDLDTTNEALALAKKNLNTLTVSKEVSKRADLELINLEARISQVLRQISRNKYLFWKKRETLALHAEVDILLAKLPQQKTVCATAKSEYETALHLFGDSDKKISSLVARQQSLVANRTQTIRLIYSLSENEPEYYAIVKRICESQTPSCEPLENYLTELDEIFQDALSKCDTTALEYLQQKLTSIEDQLRNLRTNTKMHQKDTAFVLAGTIDSSLNELSMRREDSEVPQISHIFLDEAGYTSLARGLTVFSLNVPVTFLGDHKQLPPVCQMDPILPPFAPVCLWALPVSYFSECIHEYNIDRFIMFYKVIYHGHSPEPTFSHIAYRSLNTSYRFGSLLAGILGKYIYSDRFCGLSDAPFRISVIDAPYAPGPAKRTNKTECDVIANYLAQHAPENIAVLSPYKNQVKYLRKQLPSLHHENILTVHRSQGCEWDTVVLSVVDGPNPFFVHVGLPIGRSVLNTAISRAKKELVIVCDKKQWLSYSNQLITELILTATPEQNP